MHKKLLAGIPGAIALALAEAAMMSSGSTAVASWLGVVAFTWIAMWLLLGGSIESFDDDFGKIAPCWTIHGPRRSAGQRGRDISTIRPTAD